jgi:hypothetical protein
MLNRFNTDCSSTCACIRSAAALGALGVQTVASFTGCVPLRPRGPPGLSTSPGLERDCSL